MFNKKEYKNGQKVFAFSGSTLIFFFKNGTIKAEGRYENDQMEGKWTFYRETGQLWQIGHFNNGQKHGSWKRFDKNNNLEYDEVFHEGKLVFK